MAKSTVRVMLFVVALFGLVGLVSSVSGATSAKDSDHGQSHGDHDEHHNDAEVVAEDAEVVEDSEEMLRLTAEQIAREYRALSADSALAILRHQLAIDTLVQEIRALAPEAIAGVIHDPMDTKSLIMFAGEIPEQAQKTLDAFDLPGVEVQAGFRYSRDEMADRSDALARRIATESDQFPISATVSNLETQTHTVTVAAHLPAPPEDQAQAKESTRQQVVKMLTATPLRGSEDVHSFLSSELVVEVLDAAVVEDGYEHSFGGDRIDDGDGSHAVRCTTGFSVIDGSTRGMITAGHCNFPPQNPPQSFRYHYHHNGGSTHGPLTTQGSAHIGGSGDFRWFTIPGQEKRQFFRLANSKFRATSVQPFTDIDVHDWVCRFGRASNSGQCGSVTHTDVTKTVGGTSIGKLTRLGSLGSVVGDSGGPWFLGGIAWGVHHGDFPGTDDELFSSMAVAELVLGVQLLTTP